MDLFAKIFGGIMVILTIYVAFSSNPPVGQAVIKTFIPSKINILAIVTLVGGSVGGYITFSGGHRLVDAGLKGKDSIKEATKSSISGILVTSIMRIVLFLAALGIVAKGLKLDAANPAAAVFKLSVGNVGYKILEL